MPDFMRTVIRSVSSWSVTFLLAKFIASRANSNFSGVSIQSRTSRRQFAFSPVRWKPSMMFPYLSTFTASSSPSPALDAARLYSCISSSCWLVWG